MNARVGSKGMAFARGLAVIGWIALMLLGPLALFGTWYGDCFADCDVVSPSDLAAYLIDVAAWIAIGVISFVPRVPPVRPAFRLVVACGLLFTIQGLASLIGVRGFVGFWPILPAGIVITLAGVASLDAASASSSRWASRTENDGVALGCLIYVVPFLSWFGAAAISAGNVLAIGVSASTAIAVLLIWLVVRRIG